MFAMLPCSSTVDRAAALAWRWSKNQGQQHLTCMAMVVLDPTQQQLAWLPQHTAEADLRQSLLEAAQRVWQGITGLNEATRGNTRRANNINQCRRGREPQTTTATAAGWQLSERCLCSASRVSHWSPQHTAHSLYPRETLGPHRGWHRAAHSAPVRSDPQDETGNSTDSTSRGTGSSRRDMGRAHRPLFSPSPSSNSSSSPRPSHGLKSADSESNSSSRSNRSRDGNNRAGGSKQTAAAAAQYALSDSESDSEENAPLPPTDLRNPELWYPAARSMAPRRWVAHLGPTNSGKTHAALEALAAASTGVYCGPLRLLACEVADRLNARGVPCNLVTGQEVRRVKGARHTACTVEMADLTTTVDVAVLDEVQMLGDKARGWSWTRVLLGLPAHELHLCGDPAAASLLETLAGECGDELSIQRYRRLAPLVVQPEALQGLHEVQEGDCVVAFGRKTLHRLRARILKDMSRSGSSSSSSSRQSAQTMSSSPSASTSPSSFGSDTDSGPDSWDREDREDTNEDAAGEAGMWCSHSGGSSDNDTDEDGGCNDVRRFTQGSADSSGSSSGWQGGVGMVYGALPPESRRTQAALFNARRDASCRTSVLVASDAVGMGLNLNIRRIVFTTLHKFDGAETRPLSTSEVKQIAGRAGRYASGHTEGYVSVLNAEDLPLLRQALATATPTVTHACLLPRFEQLEQFALDHYAAARHCSSSSPGRRRKRPLSFHKLLEAFASCSQLSASYLLADMKNMLALAKRLRHLEPHLGLADMYTCCISPAGADDAPVVQALLHIADSYAFERHVTPDCITLPRPDQAPRSAAEMKSCEELFRVLDLYLWLYDRLGPPGVFRGRRRVLQQRQHVAELIDTALQRMGGVKTSH